MVKKSKTDEEQTAEEVAAAVVEEAVAAEEAKVEEEALLISTSVTEAQIAAAAVAAVEGKLFHLVIGVSVIGCDLSNCSVPLLLIVDLYCCFSLAMISIRFEFA